VTHNLAEFRDKFRVDELLLFRNGGWSVSLRPGACTLGAAVISANRFHRSPGEIDAAEAADLTEAVAWFENRARAAFAADKFNHLALMMVDAHLHFHALPRYAATRDFAGLTWQDAGWPKLPDLSADNGADDRALAEVRAALAGGRAA
jgi:diadenosine tetraphosphate (Ap4A) HIT family hydrolase